jgi:lipopolysaccharide/colanic/teichoic acid biosynthesis glycosyltransferase
MARLAAVILFILTLPIYPFLFMVIKSTSNGSFLFKQKRMGKGKKVFTIYKLRTMVKDAEKLKATYQHLNEASKPAFKIKNDPRYTNIGKFLAKTALDELPQLINIIRGEMAFVGPRPLPVDEAKQIPEKFNARFSILPGLTSSWVVEGGHNLTFNQWMELDCAYVKNRNAKKDFMIIFKTFRLLFHSTLNPIMLR